MPVGWKHISHDEITLRDQIGGGGVALVYNGTFRGEPVALKTLFDPKVDENLKQEYMDELLVMSELSHPNVVTFIGACMESPKLFFVMELCERSLFDLVHGSARHAACRLPTRERARLALEVATGMRYLHSRTPAVVHRDLKTHNILEARDGAIKICDFGLVRTRNSGAGTPAYMAPELLIGQPFSKAVDVYAFGVIVNELFSGDVPFYGYDYHDIKRKVAAEERPPLAHIDTPDAVRFLIKRCWSQDVDRRPRFEEIHEDLERVVAETRDKSHCDELDDFGSGGGDCLDDLMGGSHK